MITQKDRLLKRLATCLRLDRTEPTHLHVEIDKFIAFLGEFRVPVPPRAFEDVIERWLKEHVLEKVELGQPNIMIKLAGVMLEIANDVILQAEGGARKNIQVEERDTVISKILERDPKG